MLGVLRFLLLAIILIALLRPLIGLFARLFLNAAAGPERRDNPPSSGSPEALKKDPVCGTFVAPSTALVKDKGGQTYYFCSTACRDKF